MFLLIIAINCCLKFFIAWLMYLLASWFNAPEWVTIAMVAIGACETKITYTQN